jgi:hypothetical protein
MKISKYFFVTGLISLTSCHKLDLNPLSTPSTGNFFANQSELTIAINDEYRQPFIGNDPEGYTDNYWDRATLGSSVTLGTMVSNDPDVLTLWTNCYKAIARDNAILASLPAAAANTSASVITSIEAQARFSRAYEYSRLITHFGDVPFLTSTISLDASYGITRTSSATILTFIFSELDYAASNLPATYSASSDQRWTQGAALAIKARTALYMGQYAVARDAAKAVMALGAQGVYALYPSYRNLFLTIGEQCNENILTVIQDQANGVYQTDDAINEISRLSGGYGAYIPTWDLVDSYECTDGLTVDKSPLYNPNNPFANRDPRLTQTIVPFSTNWLGYDYQPHPDTLKVMDYGTGKLVSNSDSRGVGTFASYTGFLWEKGIDQSWATTRVDQDDYRIVRYAEMLLTYAEAMIELNTIDQSTLDAINQVRARAYGTTYTQTTQYPAITTTDQAQLRTIIRRERRVEFANEGLRYMDLIRWKLAEVALTKPVVGLPDPANQNRAHWPFAGPPAIDANGIPDYTKYLASGDAKQIAVRSFNKNKQYLWPIPSVEIVVNPKLTQNPGY